MFSPRKLKGIQRRKRLIISRSDLLREETGELWEVAAHRTAIKATPLRKLKPYAPIIMTVSMAALALARSKLGPKYRYVGGACSAAGFLLSAMRPTPPSPLPMPEQDKIE